MNANELLNLLVEWGQPLTWELLFVESSGVAKYRKEADETRALEFDSLMHHARHLDATAEGCRVRALQRYGGLLKIENGIREHAPELLSMLPIIDLFGTPPDFKAMAIAMRTIEGSVRKQLSTVDNSPPPLKPSPADSVPAEYRVGGKPDGALLTADMVGEVLDKNHSLTSRNDIFAAGAGRIRHGRAYLYTWKSVVRYADTHGIDISKFQS